MLAKCSDERLKSQLVVTIPGGKTARYLTEVNRMHVVASRCLNDGRVLALQMDTGEQLRFHAIWLRDNALDTDSLDPGNGQRLLTLTQIPAEIRVRNTDLTDNSIHVTFDHDVDGVDGRTYVYPLDWLHAHAYDQPRTMDFGWLPPDLTTWTSALQPQIPGAHFDRVHADQNELYAWLESVRRFGFAMLTNGPVNDGALLAVAGLFGFVRETNYGKVFDVRAEVNPGNLAFTGAGLQAHTDNPYRDPVPTMQILYCLENSAEGGESSVVDGFACAARLRAESADAFALLAHHNARFEYAGAAGTVLRAHRPLLDVAQDGELRSVRFNNRSAAPLCDVPFDQMTDYYTAYRRFAELVDDPEMHVHFKLEPGDCFIVDNTRVLHARTAYTGTGKRWLQGCYPDKDGLLSTHAHLQAVLGS